MGSMMLFRHTKAIVMTQIVKGLFPRLSKNFASSLFIAAIPFFIQLAVWVVIISDADAYPKRDESVYSGRFWILQFSLIGLSICGNALFDLVKRLVETKSIAGIEPFNIVSTFAGIIFLSFVLALSLLNKEISWIILLEAAFISMFCSLQAGKLQNDIESTQS